MAPVRLALGTAAIVGGILLPLRLGVPASPPPKVSACTVGEQAYARLRAGQAPGFLGKEYEVSLGTTIYGPATGRSVPWQAVERWAAGHAEAGVGFCDPQGGYTMVGLSLQGGWAYVLVGPAGQLEKVYLADRPLAWD
jgi:hypothetical protein